VNTTYIYGIQDFDIQKFVYVGKSNTPCGRFKYHMKCSDNKDLRNLVKVKGTNNFKLIILEKTNFSIIKGWAKREKFWIVKFRKEGHPLCNKNDGGGGVTEHTKETRAKMSRNHADVSGENHPLYGKHRSEESKRKTSKTLMGRPKSKEHNAKNAEAHTRPYPAFYNVKTENIFLLE